MKRHTPERRRAPRRRLDQPLTSALSLDLAAEVVTIASGGAAVRLPFAPELGSRHVFILPIGADTGAEPLRLHGVVRSATKSPDGFDVGIEFEDVAVADRDRLDAFVNARLGERRERTERTE